MSATETMQVNTILQGDSLAVLKTLPDSFVDCVITSPPYWALRDYSACDCSQKRVYEGGTVTGGSPNYRVKDPDPNCSKCHGTGQNTTVAQNQLGLEPTFNEYLNKLLAIFDEVKRVLKSSGTIWVNLGDTFNGAKIGNTHGTGKGSLQIKEGQNDQKFVKDKVENIKDKSLLAIPDRFKIAMIDRGWICRNEIIWYKRNCMPSSAKDRFTVDFEKVYFFTKSERYYFETQYEPYQWASIEAMGKVRFGGNKAEGYGNPTYSGKVWSPKMAGHGLAGHSGNFREDGTPIANNPHGRLKRCVWDIPTHGFPEAHFATFPEDLVETPIKAGCPEFVCQKCGKPREPIWEPTEEYAKFLGKGYHNHGADQTEGMSQSKQMPAPGVQQYQIKGLSDCGCNVGFTAGIVLDPFFGSGTTGVVARKLGRDFLGIELNPEYIKIAERRLAPLLAQTRLDSSLG